MRSRTYVPILFLMVLLPVVASAAAWQRLKDDTAAWEQDAGSDADDQAYQEADWSFQQNEELFPDQASSSQGSMSALERSRQERIAAFVSIDTPRGLLIFSDVPKTAWFAPYVRTMATSGLIRGYADAEGNPLGQFGPGDNVTVEQMSKVLVSALGISPYDCPQKAGNPTASGSWSSPYVACAEVRHWSLFTSGTVDVHRPATRAEVVTSLLQAFNVTSTTLSGTGTVFTDVDPSMDNAGYIIRAKTDNIISGYADENGDATGLFGPNDPVTRAEFAKVVTGAMQVYKVNHSSSSEMSSGSGSSVSSEIQEP